MKGNNPNYEGDTPDKLTNAKHEISLGVRILLFCQAISLYRNRVFNHENVTKLQSETHYCLVDKEKTSIYARKCKLKFSKKKNNKNLSTRCRELRLYLRY